MRALLWCVAIVGSAWGSSITQAEDLWGCEVLLCLSNPDGPEAVSECQPPIERLRRHLRHGHPFPSCPSGGSSFAKPTSSYYDLCPAGKTELPAGQFGAAFSAPRVVHAGIGDGSILSQSGNWGISGISSPTPSKVCVGHKMGQGMVYLPMQDDAWWSSRQYQVRIVWYYDQLTLLPAHQSPSAIDVFIDNARYRRVRVSGEPQRAQP